MAAPIQITFRDISSTPALEAHVTRRSEKLATFFDRMVSCHVVVEEPHRHSKRGNKYHVRIGMLVPERTLVVTKNLEDSTVDLHATIDNAFDDAERVLSDYARLLQPDLKRRARSPYGTVSKVFHDRGYGFIASRSGEHEVYFHRNSLVNERFDKIGIGMKVRYSEEDGDKGPQASSVYVLRAS